MQSMEFQIDNSCLEPINNLILKANFDQTREWLKETLKPYQGLVVTDDAIAEAKSDKARINKLKSGIDSVRKSVKQQYIAPLTQFESRCKELTDICDSAYTNINEQVKACDEKKKAEKLEALKQYFDSIPKNHPEYADFERIYDPRWLNATSRVENAQELMTNFCTAVDDDIDAILAVNSPFEGYLLKEYKNGKSVSQIMKLNTSLLEEQTRKEEERKRAEEERAMREAEIAAAAKHEPLPEADFIMPEEPVLRQTIVPEQPKPQAEPTHKVNIWVCGTSAQLARLADLIEQAGCTYGAL